jgi:hypothetical protein
MRLDKAGRALLRKTRRVKATLAITADGRTHRLAVRLVRAA